MSKERLEEIIDGMPYSIRYSGELEPIIGYAKEQVERVQELEEKHKEYVSFTESNNYNMDVEFEKLYKQNKRYREARKIIEQVYKDNYVRNAYGYEDGYLDGLDTAMDIIDKALEGEE